jgi:peptide deformylase
MDLDNLQLLPFTDPSLFERVPEFDFENPPIDPVILKQRLVKCMLDLGGAGLAANQVGLPYRVFVMGTKENNHAIFNAKLMGGTKETTPMEEGCLSLPGVFVTLSRPIGVAVSYQTETGETVVKELVGIGARVFQHEYDHMEGRNFMMLTSPLKRQRALDKMRKKVRNEQRLVAADI